MPRLSLPARLAASLLMLATFLTATQAADAAVPDRKGWILWNQTTTSVVPTGTWPAGSTVTPIVVGRYQIKFAGQGAPNGVVHITAINEAPHWCQAETWFQAGADEIAIVRCYRTPGVLDWTSFSASFVRASAGPPHGPFGYVDANGTGGVISQFNSAGGINTANLLTTGQYHVRLPGVVTGGTFDGSVQVTAVNAGTGARCKVRSWSSGPGGQDIRVLCFDSAGVLLSTRFTLTYQYRVSLHGAAYPPKYFGYFLFQPPAGPPATNFNSVLGPNTNTSTPAGLGLRMVTFPRIAFTPNTVQVTAFGSNSNFCGLNTFWTNITPGPDLIVRDVNCFTSAGAAVNTGFTVSATSLS